jgi:hypothetical protein
MVDAVALAVGDCPLGEQRAPASTDVLQDRRRSHDIQVRVLLAGERGGRQVLSGRAGSDRVGGLFAESGKCARDRRREIARDGNAFDAPAKACAVRADGVAVIGVHPGQLIELIADRRRVRNDPPEGVRRHAKAVRHADAVDPRQCAEVRGLAANGRDLGLGYLVKIQHVPLNHVVRPIPLVVPSAEDSAP